MMMKTKYWQMPLLLVLTMLLTVASCGGGGGGEAAPAPNPNSNTPVTTQSHTVGGTVSGLVGTVVLQNNDSDDLTITANAAFTFATPLADGAGYSVTVKTQPIGQLCSVSGGSGVIAGAPVTNVSVSCVQLFTIGGTVSGLAGTLVLQNNGADDLTITSANAFTFSRAFADGSTYAVTIKSAPSTQTCLLTNSTGTINGANAANVAVACTNKSWSHPASLADNVSPDGPGVAAPQISVNSGGNSIVAWVQSDGVNNQIFKSVFLNGQWTHPTTTADHASPTGFVADSPAVAMDSNGDALIVWRQFDDSFACAGNCPSAYKSEFRNNAWSAPSPAGVLAGTNQGAFPPRAAMDDNGNALIVWRHAFGSVDGIFMSEYRNGIWTQPTSTGQHISPVGQLPQNPQVAMDNNGNAIIVWQQSDGGFTQIYKSEYRNGAWTHPANLAVNISPDGQDASAPQVAMDNNGNAIIVWLQSDGSFSQVYKSEYRGGVWAHPTNLATDHISFDGRAAGGPQVAMDNNGNALIVWQQPDDIGTRAVFKSEYRSGAWHHPAGLADNVSPATQDSQRAGGPRVAMDDNGNAMIVWEQNDDTGNIFLPPIPPDVIGIMIFNYHQVYKAEYRNGAWTAPSGLLDNISIDGQPADSPAVAMGNNGDAIIVQRQMDGSQFQIFKSEYR
jgi:surface antigen